jgi:hypothetical protein
MRTEQVNGWLAPNNSLRCRYCSKITYNKTNVWEQHGVWLICWPEYPDTLEAHMGKRIFFCSDDCLNIGKEAVTGLYLLNNVTL